MSISTDHKYQSTAPQIKDINGVSFIAQTFAQEDTSVECFEQDSIKVYVSDAESKVIASKAKKAGLSLNEYMRQAALGFPMS